MSINTMNETVSHEGVITKLTDTEVEVKIVSMSACASCHAQSACTMSDMKEKIVTVPRPEGQALQLFQKVTVTMGVGQGNLAAILAYLVPLILLVVVLFAALALGAGEGLAALIGIAAMVPYYLLLYWKRDKLKRRFRYEIEPCP